MNTKKFLTLGICVIISLTSLIGQQIGMLPDYHEFRGIEKFTYDTTRIIAKHIVSSAQIREFDNVILQGTDEVLLKDGFSSKKDSYFKAHLSPHLKEYRNRVYKNQISIKAFPNPVVTILTVKSHVSKEINGSLRISDISGRLTESIPINNLAFQLEVDTEKYKSGVYTISVVDKAGKLIGHSSFIKVN